MPAILADEGTTQGSSQIDNIRVLVPATRGNIGGRNFVRIDVRHSDGIYHSNVEIVCGDDMVGFDFNASGGKDLQALTDTLKTIHFG